MIVFVLMGFILPFGSGALADLLIFNRNKDGNEEGWRNAGPVVAISTACACIVAMILLVTEAF